MADFLLASIFISHTLSLFCNIVQNGGGGSPSFHTAFFRIGCGSISQAKVHCSDWLSKNHDKNLCMCKIFNSKSPPKVCACADSRHNFWRKICFLQF